MDYYRKQFTINTFLLQFETSRVVWSWNDNDPVDNVPAFHQLNRGSTSLNLLGGQTSRPQDPPDANDSSSYSH